MRHRFSTRSLVVMAAGLVALSSAPGLAQPQEKTAYEAPVVQPAYADRVRLARVLWRAHIDPNTSVPRQPAVAAAERRTFYVSRGRLVAVDLRSGQVRWRFGKSLAPLVAYSRGRVYTASTSGIIYAVDAPNGGLAWQTRTGFRGITRIDLAPATILVNGDGASIAGRGEGLAALDLKSGRFLWRVQGDDPVNFVRSLGPVAALEDVVLAAFVESGAITDVNLYAFRLRTGERLWRLDHHEFLGIHNSRPIFLDLPPHSPGDEIRIRSVDLETGKTVAASVYAVRRFDPGAENRQHRVVMDDGELIVAQWASPPRVYRVRLGDDPQTKPPAWLVPSGPERPLRWIAGPYDSRLFFTDRERLFVLKLVNGQFDAYPGVNNPISRLDLIDGRVYAALTDGWVYGLDIRTLTARFRVRTQARVFGPLLIFGSVLLIPAERELLAVQLP